MTDESQRPTKTVTIAHDDPAKIEDALELLRDIPGIAAWEATETRTTVSENGTTDELFIEGVDGEGGDEGEEQTGRVAIDYLTDPPRVIVHGNPVDEEPTDVIELERPNGG